MADNHSVTIREATQKDLPAILELVRELAEYEKAADELTVDIARYQEDWKSGLFEAIVAQKGGDTVGMCLYFSAYSSWKGAMLYLDDFVVRPSERGQGIGRLLFDEIIRIAKSRNAKMLKWQVLDWNEPALNFYAKYDAVIEKEWWNGKIVF